MNAKSPSQTIDLIKAAPTAEEFLRLRADGGLSQFSLEAAQKGVTGALYAVTLRRDGEAVGMGRIIGDGGCMFQVTDIVVTPDLQGQGLGKRIMTALMDWLRQNAFEGSFVSLIADMPADQLYAKFGFTPIGADSVGMETRVKIAP